MISNFLSKIYFSITFELAGWPTALYAFLTDFVSIIIEFVPYFREDTFISSTIFQKFLSLLISAAYSQISCAALSSSANPLAYASMKTSDSINFFSISSKFWNLELSIFLLTLGFFCLLMLVQNSSNPFALRQKFVRSNL